MLLPIKPVCKKANMRRDGTSIIFIQYCYSAEKRILLDSGIAIPPNFWNLKKLRISDNLLPCIGEADLLNERLQKAIRVAEDILTFAVKNKIADRLSFLKKNFVPDFDISKLEEKAKEADRLKVNLDVFFQIDEYIKSKTKQVSPKMLNVYRNMRDTLRAFEHYREESITFESFDFNFYEAFVEYMMYEHIHRRRKEIIKGFKISTVGKTIKQLRIFLRNRMRKKVIQSINLEDFKILDEESDAVYLTLEEVIKIFRVDLSQYPHLVKYQMLFVFGCLTGLRFSDFSIIEPEDVRNMLLYKKQDKSDSWVVIPLKDEAYHIFIHEFKKRIPKITNPDFNYYIKEVAKLAGLSQSIKFSHKKGNADVVTVKPKYQWITSHTCRRSFCTNEFLAGTPVELIMKISGHKSLRDFYRYIRISPEEAAQKIKELWERRGDMRMAK
jgi:site-specific recombinase XerD